MAVLLQEVPLPQSSYIVNECDSNTEHPLTGVTAYNIHCCTALTLMLMGVLRPSILCTPFEAGINALILHIQNIPADTSY